MSRSPEYFTVSDRPYARPIIKLLKYNNFVIWRGYCLTNEVAAWSRLAAGARTTVEISKDAVEKEIVGMKCDNIRALILGATILAASVFGGTAYAAPIVTAEFDGGTLNSGSAAG